MTSCPSFAEFFQALWAPHDPFPWQSMLVERVTTGPWPQALDLPTATGKTACIDAAIYALASQAEQPVEDRSAPRRIWFVVDRRIVVDEAFDRASTIARKLEDASDGPLKLVADRLRLVSGTERSLAVARLRGGVLRDDGWARLPSQPAVITSTVDQLGSRLLFRGYGRSHLTASIFAGLAAHDSLILLDEAHCSVPFLQTLQSIEKYRTDAWAEAPIRTPFAFVILSATPPPGIPDESIFPGSDREVALNHPVLHQRLRAKKPAELVTVKTSAKAAGDPLVVGAAKRAEAYLKDGKQRLAVIVNRVLTAQRVAEDLGRRVGDHADVVLLTGHLRPYERDRLVERWKPVLKASSPEKPDKPVVLVSTQCIEVGADFSFDALVTEAASLDALRQRFGRLNRMGLEGEAPATIIVRDTDTKDGQQDPIYGTAIAECWRLLDKKADSQGQGKDARKTIDFGFEALDVRLADVEDFSPCLAPPPQAPILLPAHLDLLCQTAPTPRPEPDVQLFLHGTDRGASEVRVVWRADLPSTSTETWKETVALCPPSTGETLSVLLNRLRAWLADPDVPDAGASDVEGVPAEEQGDNGQRGSQIRPVLVWRGRDRSKVCRRASQIKPNDVVVLPARYGFGGLGQSEPAEAMGSSAIDIWEPVRLASGRPAALRVHRAVLEPWLQCPLLKELLALAEDPAWERDAVQGALDLVLEYPPAAEEQAPSLPDWLQNLMRQVRGGRIEEHPSGGLVLFARGGQASRSAESDLFADDDDLLSAIGREVSLATHSALVERAVKQIGSRCLPEELLQPLLRAAYWHDVGKLDERFQLLLRQGDELAAVSGEPLAKSSFIPTSPARRRAIREASGLPQDFRHEMLSLQIAERYAPLPSDEAEAELTLHLVASHHGHARPFAPVSPDPDPPAVSGCHDGVVFEIGEADRSRWVAPHHLASGISERFWQLTRRYGWWGLAYLEAVLRLGDWYGSQWTSDDEPEREETAPAHPARGIRVPETADSIVLTGLDGANPLGFLAALGILATLHQAGERDARLSWRRSVTWQPVLSGISLAALREASGTGDEDSQKDAARAHNGLCKMLADGLRGKPAEGDAQERRQESQAAFDAAKKAVKDRLEAIKQRRLRGNERKEALEREVTPLRQVTEERRREWLEALKAAVPRADLAIGRHIDCTADEFRDHAAGFLDDPDREALDLLASFASDACLERSGRVTATPFCFITGSGHQYFLDTVRQLMDVVAEDRLSAALFDPWTYVDEKLSMRWDPIEDRRYALMDRDPTASDNRSRTVWMANLLAYRALVLLPSAPRGAHLVTTGWTWDKEAKSFSFTWPIWEPAMDVHSIRSLFLLRELASNSPDHAWLRERGIVAAFRARRIQVGNPPLHKINFSPARNV
jgi:CRISPR-associated endonuclease/helicase Cas3